MVLQRLCLSALSLELVLTGCRPWTETLSADSPIVLGAGASFPSPLYQRWFSHLRVRKGIRLGYDPWALEMESTSFWLDWWTSLAAISMSALAFCLD